MSFHCIPSCLQLLAPVQHLLPYHVVSIILSFLFLVYSSFFVQSYHVVVEVNNVY